MSAYKKLNANDVKITPFEAHKQYTISQTGTGSYGVSGSYSFFTASWTSESKDLFSDANRRYFQLDHLYYRDFLTTIDNRLDVSDIPYTKQERRLYEKANILGISQKNFGSGIQPGIFTLTGSFSGSQFNIKDDGYGNLYDDSVGTSNVIDPRNVVFRLGPDKGFKKYDLTADNNTGKKLVNPPTEYSAKNIYDDSLYLNTLEYKNIRSFNNFPLFKDNILSQTQFPAVRFVYNSSPTIVVPHNQRFNFNNSDDFTICFWYDNLRLFTSGDQFIIGKSTTQTIVAAPNNQVNTDSPYTTTTTGSSQFIDVASAPQYPFEIYAGNDGNDTPSIFFRRSDGNLTTTISASFNTSSGAQPHDSEFLFVTCRYSASQMELFLNGTGTGNSGSDNLVGSTQNQANIYIGSKGDQSNYLGGYLSQINIINTALTDIQIENFYSSSNGSSYIGNIFYDSGIATITHPQYLEVLGSVSSSDDWTATYKNTHLIYEHEITCTVAEDEFNQTRNITTRKIQSTNSDELANFATGSLFKPYVTTVGLYNDEGDLLVVGKLGQPTKTSNETDTTFILRYDT
jgi:hypothetical protein